MARKRAPGVSVSEQREGRCAPQTYHDAKAIILHQVRVAICSKGLQPRDIKPGYPSWRRELHTRLLREEDHYFSLTSALILAEATRVKVEVTAQ